MEENKTITPRKQLLVISSAIILAGMASNYSTTRPSIILARGYAQELLASILDGEEVIIIIKEKGRTQRPHLHPPVISLDIICLAHLL